MNHLECSTANLAIIGGGIAGLAAAHRAIELDPGARVTLFEASSRLGGSLHTERHGEFLIEQGADSFITNTPWGVDLCRRVGLDDQLLPTAADYRRVFVVRRGKLLPVPEGFVIMAPGRVWPLLTSRVLSWRGKLRLACEYFVGRRRETADESLASFARRRLGHEAFERLVQPLAAGIYTADPEQLSLAATLPRFIEMERRYGSLIRGATGQGSGVRGQGAEESGARYSMFVTPRDGLSSLVSAIAARLPAGAIRLGTAVERIERAGLNWRLTLAGAEIAEFDAVVIALPAPIAARLLQSVDPPLADELAAIHYASAAVVSLAYDRQQIKHRLDGFGFVVPAIERRRILSASFSSVKFPGRAPVGKALIRVFVGGACQPELFDLPDDQIVRLAQEELAELLEITGSPLLTTLARWPQSMAQYHLGHLDRVARIESRVVQLGGLALAGNGYRGVGIPSAIHSGETAAETLLQNGPD